MKSRVSPKSRGVGYEGCCCGTDSHNFTKPELKEGNLHIIVQDYKKDAGGKNTATTKKCSCKVPVNVKIYSNGFDHYAVLQKDNKKYGNGAVYVNLRNCKVLRSDKGKNCFFVSSVISEGHHLLFETNSADEVEEWVDAFTGPYCTVRKSSCQVAPNLSPAIPRTSLLPTLIEETEEEE